MAFDSTMKMISSAEMIAGDKGRLFFNECFVGLYLGKRESMGDGQRAFVASHM